MQRVSALVCGAVLVVCIAGCEGDQSVGSNHGGKHYVGWGRDYNAALAKAKAENKSMLLLFTGSDWCPPCQALHETVFLSKAFKSEIPDAVVLMVCDNPRDKSLVSAAERQQYQKLSDRFQVSGVPALYLTDSNGKSYHEISGYGGTSATQWVKELKSKIRPGN